MTRELFIISNLAILFGYLFLSIHIAPKIAVKLRRTKVGAVLFFLTCGITHAELMAHAITDQLDLEPHMLGPVGLTVHVIQAFAVWLFVSGLYSEFVRHGTWPVSVAPQKGCIHGGKKPD